MSRSSSSSKICSVSSGTKAVYPFNAQPKFPMTFTLYSYNVNGSRVRIERARNLKMEKLEIAEYTYGESFSPA